VSVGVMVAMTLVAGGVGAVLRAFVVRALPSSGTAVVNVVGTSVLALALVAQGSGALTTSWTVVIGVGLTGSLTTFSGWMAEVDRELRDRPARTLLLKVLVPLLLGVAVTVVAFALIA
jgi:CrcB protein